MAVQTFSVFKSLLLASTALLCIISGGVFASNEVTGIPDHSYANVDQELILTQKQKVAFDKFKAAVWTNITEEWKDYLKQDLFLLRYIRAKNLNVDVATRDMFTYLNFLRTNKLEKIVDEDFSDITPDYPIYTTYDREGRPILYGAASLGWNLRRGVIQGRLSRLMRYSYKLTFHLWNNLIEVNRKQPNVTQVMVLMNMEGFNAFQHSCAACITSYLNLLEIYERFLPGYVKEIIVINAPQAYLVLLQVLQPVLSPATRKSLHVFGANKNQWKPYLDARIDASNLPWEFGGTGKLQHLV